MSPESAFYEDAGAATYIAAARLISTMTRFVGALFSLAV